ncbi:MAG: PhnD/SsuA/transferrin family substrate-binding protein [Mesorhizobium sp.]|nr:PhnD/SsuA/transferrin family substrate-binding protein [Mesorhizobium sp.]
MTDFVAALPMYDWAETRAATDAQWARLRDGLRAAGIAAPERLTRRNADLPPVPGGISDAAGHVIAPDPATLPPDGFDLPTLWRHPNLLFAQTCWGPLETTDLGSYVQVIGQPDYSDVDGGEGAFYSSAIVMRAHGGPSPVPSPRAGRGEGGAGIAASPLLPVLTGRRSRQGDEGHVPAPADGMPSLRLDLLRNTRLAFNSRDSMSGILALTRDLEAAGESLGIFAERIETGAHRASVVAVAEGRADVATIDCRTWDLIQRFEPAAEAVTVVGWTRRRKGLPFIAAAGLPAETTAVLRAALADWRTISPKA